MAKDDRKILSGVRIGDAVYTEGQEDELAEAMTEDQMDRLLEEGAIEGTWSPGAKSSSTTETRAASKTSAKKGRR